MLEHAQAYAAAGWAVFPCHNITTDGVCSCGKDCGLNAGKHPLFAPGLNAATTDPELIRRWWTTWPDANIGYRPPEGTVIVDVDNKPGKPGAATLAGLTAFNSPLPDTITAITGSGGRHHHFRCDKPMPNAVELLPGIDMRTHKGYVLLPPSNHFSGQRYEWAVGGDPRIVAITDMPEWFYSALMQGKGADRREPLDVSAEVPEGSRNATLTREAGRLRQTGYGKDAMLAALLALNEQVCSPPLDAGEVEKIANSVARYPKGELPATAEMDFAGVVYGQTSFAEFIPFEQGEALPVFPLNVLPTVIREYVDAAAETVQAPIDMVGACTFGMLEIACRNRYPVRLPNGHVERPCFYIAPIAPPSERKSGVIDVVSRPLVDYEIEYNQIHGGEVNQSQSELKLLQGRIANAEQKAIKEKNIIERQTAERELQALNEELAEFEPTEPLRLFGADVTPEKLASMLKSQGGVFALVSAEGGGLFENIGRYSDKGGMEIYLNGYSGDRICVDRKTSASIVIDRPTLNLIAPCQPSVIVDLFSDRQKSGRGLLSRIVFIKCPSRVGSRKARTNTLDQRIAANYRNLCCAMLAATDSGDLEYDDQGFEVYSSFFDEIEPQLSPDIGELHFMADWAGKLHGLMTRLAGLIHCIAAFERGQKPLETWITADEALAAATLARYYLAHAKAVYTEQAEPSAISNARYLWGKIKSINSPQISKSILTRKTQGKQGFDINESLRVLVSRGYVRLEVLQQGTAGRPSETVIVNPEA